LRTAGHDIVEAARDTADRQAGCIEGARRDRRIGVERVVRHATGALNGSKCLVHQGDVVAGRQPRLDVHHTGPIQHGGQKHPDALRRRSGWPRPGSCCM
jgi:hypothetical protein